MLIQIDMHSSVPIYKQLKTAIVQGILSGELTEGERLPSVRQLGCDLGINLHTVNKVYSLLKDEGYIKIHRSLGAVISAPPEAGNENMADFMDALYPIIVEMRAKRITKTQFHDVMDEIWERCISGMGGNQNEY